MMQFYVVHSLQVEGQDGLSVRTNVGSTGRFWYHRYELDSFSCHPVTRQRNIFIWVHIYSTWGKRLWKKFSFNSLLNGRSGAHKLCTHFLRFSKFFRPFGHQSQHHQRQFLNLFTSLERAFLTGKKAANHIEIDLQMPTQSLVEVLRLNPRQR